MDRKTRPSVEPSLKRISRVLGSIAVVVGVLVLIGWAMDVSALKSVLPGLATMKANTALAFVLSGTTVWLMASASLTAAGPAPLSHRSRAREWIARACAALVALIGLLTVTQYLFGWELGIDELLAHDRGPQGQMPHPGRPSLGTAVNFALLGAAFLTMDVELQGRRWPAQWLVLAVLLDAFVAVLGYAYDVPSLYHVFAYTSMALHTAALFVLLPIGFLFARPSRGLVGLATGDDPGGALTRRLLPAALLVAPALGALCLAAERAGLYAFEFGLALLATATVLVFSALVWSTARSVRDVDAERREAERSLHATEERFHLLADTVTDYAIFLLDREGNVETWTSGAQRMKGYASDEIVGRNFACFYTPEDRELGKPEQALRVAEANGRHQEEAWSVRKDGSRFLADAVLTALRDSEGRLTGFAKITREITQRKQAEEALRKSQEQLLSLVEQAPISIAMFDRNMRYIVASRGWVAEYGRGYDDLVGRHHYEVHPDLPERWKEVHRRSLAGEFLRNNEDSWVQADGSVHWLRWAVHPWRDARGEIGGIIMSAEDITERKRTEARFRATVESAPIAMIMTDASGAIVLVNAQTEKLFGYGGHELLGQAVEVLVPERFRSQHREMRARFLAAPAARLMGAGRDLYGLRKDGREVPVEIGLSPVRTEEGLFVLSAITDITERKQMEAQAREHTLQLARQAEALKRANEALERSNVELQQFAYVASHDLQTPLRNISGFVQLLKLKYENELDEQADEWIRRTVQATQRMHTLIRDVLEYSRVDAQSRPFEPVACGEVFDEAVALLGASIHDLGGQVTCDELPTVMGDRAQLVQLMQNLIGNGLKYHGKEPPHVHVCAARNGTGWVFSIRDNGIGIPPKQHERIFEIFRRLHGAHAYPGTGIGLAVCRRIVNRHGGRIWVESEPGHGSVFHFTIPVRTVDGK